eukprot:CAMPEP_0115553550 /NCGR_PEP_ID=MMETSP0271-20121206/96834_1 /TAXON_ID=71861 /ORGANISM="Scrippsiella trochoidea, Strain CCMP3099" /LENGTH=78 /DNA_ID=CAMNT_0002987245 /DNA_START=234 /DNA_END=470 /DNA_ORIENTATION=+
MSLADSLPRLRLLPRAGASNCSSKARLKDQARASVSEPRPFESCPIADALLTASSKAPATEDFNSLRCDLKSCLATSV